MDSMWALCMAGPLREIPDHATFREKEHTPGWLDKLGGVSLFNPM